jgi:hypothetical protein
MSVANVVTQKSRSPSRLRRRGMDDPFLIALLADHIAIRLTRRWGALESVDSVTSAIKSQDVIRS